MQLSFPLLLCLIDLKAEQKEGNDRVVANRPLGARHRIPRLVVPVSNKIARIPDLMCAFLATLTKHFGRLTPLWPRGCLLLKATFTR